MKKNIFILLLICGFASAQTPYPTEIVLKQINGGEKERVRHAQNMRKFDQQPTGFYVEAGKKPLRLITAKNFGRLFILYHLHVKYSLIFFAN